MAFDSSTGDLWIGDVGQNRYEEVDHVTAQQAGANLGWDRVEGFHHFEGAAPAFGSFGSSRGSGLARGKRPAASKGK